MKELSRVAKVSKAIRQDLKAMGIKAKVQSSSGTWSDAIRVYLSNERPEVVDKVNKMVCKYKAGYFDGMNDIYEYTNKNDLSVEYIFVENIIDNSIRDKAEQYLRDKGWSDDAVNDNLYKVLRGCYQEMIYKPFWYLICG